jgi:hypothetical protein
VTRHVLLFYEQAGKATLANYPTSHTISVLVEDHSFNESPVQCLIGQLLLPPLPPSHWQTVVTFLHLPVVDDSFDSKYGKMEIRREKCSERVARAGELSCLLEPAQS